MWEEDPDGELGLWIDEDVFGLDAGKWIGGGRKAVVGEEPLDTAAFEDAEGREELEDNPISIAKGIISEFPFLFSQDLNF